MAEDRQPREVPSQSLLGADSSDESETADELRDQIRIKLREIVRKCIGEEEFNKIKDQPAAVTAKFREVLPTFGEKSYVDRQIKAVENQKPIAKRLVETSQPLSDGESATVAVQCPKTAALCFDRVWSPIAPDDIRFSCGSPAEVEALAYLCALTDSGDDRLSPALFEPQGRVILAHLMYTAAPTLSYADSDGLPVGGSTLDSLVARALSDQVGYTVPAVYTSDLARSRDYVSGATQVIVATLSDLEIVDESKASWEQILEFRDDSDAVKKYRRFVHWLDKNMVGKSQSFISDAITERVEDYRWALRKHGLETVTGTFAAMLDHKTLIAGAAASSVAVYAGEQMLAALAAVSAIIGQATLFVATELLNLEDLRRTTNPEIAFVHEAKQRFGA